MSEPPDIAVRYRRSPYTQALIDRLERALAAERAENQQLRAERDRAMALIEDICRLAEEMRAKARAA